MVDSRAERLNAAFAALEDALHTAKVSMRLDLRKLCHPHCPLPFDHYKTKLAYAYIVLAVALFFGLTWLDVGRMPFWSTLIGFTVVFWIGVRPVAERSIRRRIVAYVMEDPERLEKVWKYGGVTLVAADGSQAAAPSDDWRRLVIAAGADQTR